MERGLIVSTQSPLLPPPVPCRTSRRAFSGAARIGVAQRARRTTLGATAALCVAAATRTLALLTIRDPGGQLHIEDPHLTGAPYASLPLPVAWPARQGATNPFLELEQVRGGAQTLGALTPCSTSRRASTTWSARGSLRSTSTKSATFRTSGPSFLRSWFSRCGRKLHNVSVMLLG